MAIHIYHATDIMGQPVDMIIPSVDEIEIQAKGLTLFPGLIDPHVHFRTPGMEYKEDWHTAANAAIHGGYTTVFDMPNTLPPTITAALLNEKKSIINAQLQETGIPLRYQLFFGADKNHLDQIPQIKDAVIGIKVFMGCSTGNLVIDDDESLHAVFEIASANQLLVAVHAEDENRMHAQKAKYFPTTDYADHSHIRDIQTAEIAVRKAIDLSRRYQTKLYVLHVSSESELELIRKAKQEGLNVYAETTPHHLFLNSNAYGSLHGKAVVNPPLRSHEHNQAVLKAIQSGLIDTIGSDHAPHTIDEKSMPYGQCPSGMPGIETTLPLLLTAYHQGSLDLETIVRLTSYRARDIFNLAQTQDYVLVDLHKKATVTPNRLKTKCAWSAFAGHELTGWPAYTIVNGRCFKLTH